MFFFFFQAEDGIRDLTVTGVQTCALPIYRWIKNFVIVGTVDVAILGAALYFLYNPLTLIAAGLLYSVPLYILMIRYSRRVSQFKREWREQHPSLTPA